MDSRPRCRQLSRQTMRSKSGSFSLQTLTAARNPACTTTTFVAPSTVPSAEAGSYSPKHRQRRNLPILHVLQEKLKANNCARPSVRLERIEEGIEEFYGPTDQSAG